MKILHLCNKIPYPPFDGGSIAMLRMARSFAQNDHEVTMMAMVTGKHNISPSEIPGYLQEEIRFIYIDVDTRIRPVKLLLNLIFSTQPYNALRFIHRNFIHALNDLLSTEKFDIVQLEGLYLKPYIPLVRKYHQRILSYRAHNVESEIWQRIAETTRNKLKSWYLKLLAKRILRYETEMIKLCDILIPISTNDYNWFQTTGNTKPAFLTPTGVSDEDFNPPRKLSQPVDLFYIGALDWIPNQEALSWFIEQVWKELKRSHSGQQLHIAGRNAPGWLVRKFNNAGIVFHGEVENAFHFIDSHSVMVIPLFAGSGLRIKIVEAMARSKAIITTSVGIQGIQVTSGKEIIIANTAGEFIQNIEQLLQEPGRIEALQKHAYEFARQNFNNNILVKNLLYFYTHHISC